MSIAEFSTALKNKAVKDWFYTESNAKDSYRKDNINTIVNATSDYRSAEQTAAKTSFLITRDTVRDLLIDIKGLNPSDPSFESIVNDTFDKFGRRNAGAQVNRRKIKVGSDLPAVYFSTISFDTITSLVNNILDLKPKELAEKYEKGHVVGLNTELLRITAGRLSQLDARAAAGAKDAKAILLRELDKVIEYYKRLDFDSANIQPAGDVSVYASVNKSISKIGKTHYLVELQPKTTNQRSADEVKATIGSIRKLFTPGALSEKAMGDIITKISKSVTDPQFAQDLVQLRSSPNLIDMVKAHIVGIITGKPVDQKYNVPLTKIASKKVPKVDLSELRSVVQDELKKVQDLQKQLSQSIAQQTVAQPVQSLVSLESLLKLQIQAQIIRNMGLGDRKDVLNYRTGRFAESVFIERLTQSKEGMISVFYDYMQYPYATFSQGGLQQSPKTRDPKLLISKSIREIGAKLVTNRMRAVLV
jgi:hypothetical protein